MLFANAITADMGMIPGFALVGPAMGFPLSVLAAFLERPAYTRAGVSHSTIWYSLQANFVSLILGYLGTFLLLPIAMYSGPDLALLCPIVAVAKSSHLNWVWIAIANVFSAGACIVIVVVSRYIRNNYEYFALQFDPVHDVLQVMVGFGSCVLFVISFLVPRIRPPVSDHETAGFSDGAADDVL